MCSGRHYVISMAGFDPSGGAGILGDIKTFEQHDVQGLGVCTAITIQTEDRFDGVAWLQVDLLISQLKALLERYPVSYLKIGIIENFKVLGELLEFMKQHFPHVKMIWDPVIKASAGYVFHHDQHKQQFLACCKHMYLVTPNAEEAMLWMSEKDVRSATIQMQQVTRVFLKSTVLQDGSRGDLLIADGRMTEYPHQRLEGYAKHGSGCVISAAITALLAVGNSLPDSCRLAADYTYRYLKSAPGLLGSHLVSKNNAKHA